jgi:hypothetical protein
MNELSTCSRRVVAALVAGSAAVLGLPTAELPSAKADTLAYLVNVTVRPGYNFANADQALGYGYGVCDKVATGRTYAQVMGDIKADFNTANEYQASHLIAQTAQELCPAQIWQIRTSAAGYAAPPD